jgi:hypothetical protein
MVFLPIFKDSHNISCVILFGSIYFSLLIEAHKEIQEGKAKILTADEHIKALHNDI